MTHPIIYDNLGRMHFNPDFHGKHQAQWTTGDEKFLIENYYVIGPEQISFALERTIKSVMQRAFELRQKGELKRPAVVSNHARTSNKRK